MDEAWSELSRTLTDAGEGRLTTSTEDEGRRLSAEANIRRERSLLAAKPASADPAVRGRQVARLTMLDQQLADLRRR